MSTIPEKRYFILTIALCCVFCVLIFRLFDLTVLQHRENSKKNSQIEMNMMRGTIYSYDHSALAISLPFYSIYMNPKMVVPSNKFDYIRFFQFFGINNIEADKITHSKRQFKWIKRMIPKKLFHSIQNSHLLSLPGVGFIEEYQRVYPYKSLASHILGFTNLDGLGIAGLEYKANDLLKPNITNNRLFGYDIVLTLNLKIQKAMYNILKQSMEELNPNSISSIIMEAKTGRVLGMSSFPTFNPNIYNQYTDHSVFINNNISYMDEPGSTFKPLIMAYLFDHQMLKTTDRFSSKGKEVIKGFTIKEALGHKLGLLSPHDIIVKSSNIGMAKASNNLNKKDLYQLLTDLNLTKKTQIFLPGEAKGIVRSPSSMSARSVISISFGQEIAITPLQLVSAFTSLVNEGYRIAPRIIDHIEYEGDIISSENNILNKKNPEKIYSKKNAHLMLKYMRDVVLKGSARRLNIKGDWIAAKTGTAQIFDIKTHTYSKINTSLIAIYHSPITKKKYIILVIIRNPDVSEKRAFGSTLAAPIVKDIIIALKKVLQKEKH